MAPAKISDKETNKEVFKTMPLGFFRAAKASSAVIPANCPCKASLSLLSLRRYQTRNTIAAIRTRLSSSLPKFSPKLRPNAMPSFSKK